MTRTVARQTLIVALSCLVSCVHRSSNDVAPALPPAGVPAASAAPSTCSMDFDSTTVIVRRDYAGYPTKGVGHEAALASLTDSVRHDVSAATDVVSCTKALRRWIAFFRDRHLSIVDRQPSAAADAVAMPSSANARLPTLSTLDDSTLLLRLPDFGQSLKPTIDSLLHANSARLAASPYLIIDVRGNGGGWTASYSELLPFIYTDPIRVDGVDAWGSPGNIAALRALVASTSGPAAIRAQARVVLARMEAHPGTFVLFASDTVVTLPSVYPTPRAVAIIVDHRCASTCEQFVLDARQSRKIVVLGSENTGGLLDFGNARAVELPSRGRRLHVPFTRSHRLPATPLDLTGVGPAVRIPPGTADAIEYVRKFLAAKGSGR